MLHFLLVIFVFLIIIGFVIGVHELGHFVAAKWMGVKVICFSLGFGKKLFCLRDKHGTEYALSMIPLGGYVKLLDEREGYVAPEEQILAFNRKPAIKKIVILTSGVICNLLLGILAYWWMFTIGFITVVPVIGSVQPDSIAAQAGLKRNDKIVRIGGHSVTDWRGVVLHLFRYYGDKNLLCIETESLFQPKYFQCRNLNLASWKMDELTPNPLESLGISPYTPKIPAVIDHFTREASPQTRALLERGDKIISIEKNKIGDWTELLRFIQKNPGKSVRFIIKRDEKILPISLTLGSKRALNLKKKGYLGIGNGFVWPDQFLTSNRYPVFQALQKAIQESIDLLLLNVMIIGKLLVGKISLYSLGGPIAIFVTTETAVGIGFDAILNVLGFVSLSLAIVNFLPIPGLDGGHVLITLIERIRRKPVSMRVQTLLYRLGIIFILMLLLIAIGNDLARLFLN